MTTTALISVQRSAQKADERVMRTVEGEIPPFDEVLSPELALVDSKLAAGARERLPEVEVLALRPLPGTEALDEVLAATARRLAQLRLAPPEAPPALPSSPEDSTPARGAAILDDSPPSTGAPTVEPGPPGAASTRTDEAPPRTAVPTADDSQGAAPTTANESAPRAPLPRLEEPRAALPTPATARGERAFEPVERAWGAPDPVAPAEEIADDAARRLADVSLTAQVERGPRSRQILAGAAASCAAVAIALLAADRALDRDAEPAAQASVTLEQPDATSETPNPTTTGPASTVPTQPENEQPTPNPPAKPRSSPTSGAPGAGPRTFAWAPVAGATGYHVELFRVGKRIFAVDTQRPNALIPARWTFDGRRYRLAPAEYRWYVWPIVAGKRKARAVVQARLVVGPA
jgi:hypothetical protein